MLPHFDTELLGLVESNNTRISCASTPISFARVGLDLDFLTQVREEERRRTTSTKDPSGSCAEPQRNKYDLVLMEEGNLSKEKARGTSMVETNLRSALERRQQTDRQTEIPTSG